MRTLLLCVLFVACTPTTSTPLPSDFLYGAGTSAHQVEGGTDNDWTQWEHGFFPDGGAHIRDGHVSGLAADSWHRWPEDVTALTGLGANAYRLSLEWSRLEPEEGQWSLEAVDNYRQQLEALHRAGIVPFVTLHHFTLPHWVSARGGWEDARTLASFEAFARRAGAQFGDLVDFWVTINEPSVQALLGYITGLWPPGVQSLERASNVYLELMKGHARAAAALRETDVVDTDSDGFSTRIGLAHHVLLIEPASSSELDATIAALTDDWANESVPRAAKTGRMTLYAPGLVNLDEQVDGLQGSFDFLGLNQYYRVRLRADVSSASLSQMYSPPGDPTGDNGGAMHPDALRRLLVRFKAYGWPMVVTENGLADAADSRRPDFVRATFEALRAARDEGADVRGYLHWSLIDNFEWSSGFDDRFGLYSINREPRPSVDVFRAQTGR